VGLHDEQVGTYTRANTHVQMPRLFARRETNRLFVDRRMTNCFGITFLRELCSRILPSLLSSPPSSSPFRRISAKVIPLLKRFHPPYISICIRLKRFICHRGELQSTSIRTFYTFDLPRLT